MTYRGMESYVDAFADKQSAAAAGKKAAASASAASASAASASAASKEDGVAGADNAATTAAAVPEVEKEKKERKPRERKPKTPKTEGDSAASTTDSAVPVPAPAVIDVAAVATHTHAAESNRDAKEKPRRQKKEKADSDVRAVGDKAPAPAPAPAPVVKNGGGGGAFTKPAATTTATAAAVDKKTDVDPKYVKYEGYKAENIATAARGDGQKRNPQVVIRQATDGSCVLLGFCSDWPAGEKGHVSVTDKGAIKAEVFNIGAKHRSLRQKWNTLEDLKNSLRGRPFDLTDAELTALETYSRVNRRCMPN